MYWDTFQRGLALRVEPSGHLAWKCVYTIRGRGARWYHMGNASAITLADARKLASKILYQVAEGADPHADRLALRGRGSIALRFSMFLRVLIWTATVAQNALSAMSALIEMS